MNPDRLACVPVVFYGELRLRVRSQVRHQLRGLLAYLRKYLQGLVRECERQRHVLVRVAACVAEHHALVPGPLLVRVCHDHPAVDVLALLVQGGEHPAGVPVEHVVRLVVANPVDHASCDALYVHVCIFRSDFPSYDHKSCAAESLARYFRLRILPEELVQDGI